MASPVNQQNTCLKWGSLAVCTVLLSLGAMVFSVGVTLALLVTWGVGRAMAQQARTCTILVSLLAAIPVLTMGTLMYCFDILRYSCDAQPLYLLRYVQPLCVIPALICMGLSIRRPEHGTRWLCAAGALLWLPAMLMVTGPCCHEPYGSFGDLYEGVLLLLGLGAATQPSVRPLERYGIALLYLALSIPAQLQLYIMVQSSGILQLFPTLG